MQDYELTLTVVVTAYEWEHHLEWQFQDSYGIRGMQGWDLQPQAGATKLIMRDEYTMPTTLGKILDRFVNRHAVKLRDHSWLDRLKRLAERPAK